MSVKTVIMVASEKELIQAIKLLPLAKRIYVIEETLKSIKLYEDYLKDKNLTAFTALDFDNFYEAKGFVTLNPEIGNV